MSGQASRPGSQPPSTSSSHETPPEAYSKFPFLLAKSPFVKLAGSCFLLLESKNILTHLVSHNSVLTARQPGWPQWRKGPGREEEGQALCFQDTPLLSASPIRLLWLSQWPLLSWLPLQVYFSPGPTSVQILWLLMSLQWQISPKIPP